MYPPQTANLSYYLQLTRELLTLPTLQWHLRTFPLQWKVEEHAYGNHSDQRLWIIRPESQSKGVVVFFHGGGWIFGDQRMLAPSIHEWVNDGWTVLAPAYRKLPKYSVPHNLEDLDQLLQWLVISAPAIFSPDLPLFFGGMSAGGHIAALATLDIQRHQLFGFDSKRIKGLLLLAPPLSLKHMPKTPILNWYLAKSSQLKSPNWDPVQTLSDSFQPPLLLIHGTHDRTVPMVASKVFADQYQGPKSLHYLEALGHYHLPYWGIGKQPHIRKILMEWLNEFAQ